NELAKTFNRVTQDLEQKITALEQSKRLIQNLFRKVGEAITTTEKIDQLMMLVIESMVTALDAESGVLMLAEIGESRIKTKLAYGIQEEFLSGLTLRKGEGAFGWVVEKGKPLMVASSMPDYQFDANEIGVSYRSLLCVPLRYQGRVLGLVAVINKKQNEGFNNDEQLLLENVADQVAVAIENARLNADAEKVYFETISALAMAVEAKDAYTRGHLKRVSDYVGRLARLIGFDERTIQLFKDGAFLHDLGKIAIPDNILLKPDRLSAEEMEVMKEHTIIGENIIAPLSSFKELRAMVRHHQEWFDGSGYPDHLKGDGIPIGARILAVADVYDALTTDRPYRKALPHHVAMELIYNETGTHFDPVVVRAFSKMMGDSKDSIASAA
ncbi:MAG: GAF domain-containing protein, partial [Candidatus Omnitrophica bacterium]|nr:GAF domain-containing protein [Candidatus Omnitrophota bacterium]